MATTSQKSKYVFYGFNEAIERWAKFGDIFLVTSVYEGIFPRPAFANNGNSGSLIVEDAVGTNRGVGLSLAVSKPLNDAYGCTFENISKKLDIEL